MRIGCDGAGRGLFHPTYLRTQQLSVESSSEECAGRPARPENLTAKPRPRTAPARGGLRRKWYRSELRWLSLGRSPFEGDVAIKALRDRLSVDRDLPLTLPRPRPRKTFMPLAGRLSSFGAITAALGCGLTLTRISEPQPVLLPPEVSAVAALPSDPGRATIAPSAHLVIKRRQAFANEPLPLGVSVDGGTGGEVAFLSGLLAGTRLSVGSALGGRGWRVAARDLTTAMAYAPPDFIGVMNAAVDVRTPSDTLVDRSVMPLEWIGKRSDRLGDHARPARSDEGANIHASPERAIAQSVDSGEIAVLLKRGNDYLKSGDLVAARTVLRRAADDGSADAALTLGSTFDPIVFKELGVLGFAPDAAQARAWYERAAQLGSAEGTRRIDRLTLAGHGAHGRW